MSTLRRRRTDQESLKQIVGTPATVPTATGVPHEVERPASEPSHSEIARRAYHLYEARGGDHGRDWQDWFQAERELRVRALHDVIDRIIVTGEPYAVA